MISLIFATGNGLKFSTAQKECAAFGVTLVQEPGLEIVEIQSEEGEPIARHKAAEAFKLLQKPLVITDDSWHVAALRGFPGAYMKSINHWLTADDWLRLMHGVTDRRVTLQQIAVYQDAHQQKLFAVDIVGIILNEVRGVSKNGAEMVMSLDDGKRSIAETFGTDDSALKERHNVWRELCAWLPKAQNA